MLSPITESVKEVLVSGPTGIGGWLDVHVVAGIVSAVLLTAALIICICVAVRRRKYEGYRLVCWFIQPQFVHDLQIL